MSRAAKVQFWCFVVFVLELGKGEDGAVKQTPATRARVVADHGAVTVAGSGSRTGLAGRWRGMLP